MKVYHLLISIAGERGLMTNAFKLNEKEYHSIQSQIRQRKTHIVFENEKGEPQSVTNSAPIIMMWTDTTETQNIIIPDAMSLMNNGGMQS